MSLVGVLSFSCSVTPSARPCWMAGGECCYWFGVEEFDGFI